MVSVVDQLRSLIASILSVFKAALGSVIAIIQTIINTVLGIIRTAFSAVGATIKGLAQTFEGLVGFILGNIVVIGALVAAFFAYTYYTRNNRTGSAKVKKTA